MSNSTPFYGQLMSYVNTVAIATCDISKPWDGEWADLQAAELGSMGALRVRSAKPKVSSGAGSDS